LPSQFLLTSMQFIKSGPRRLAQTSGPRNAATFRANGAACWPADFNNAHRHAIRQPYRLPSPQRHLALRALPPLATFFHWGVGRDKRVRSSLSVQHTAYRPFRRHNNGCRGTAPRLFRPRDQTWILYMCHQPTPCPTAARRLNVLAPCTLPYAL